MNDEVLKRIGDNFKRLQQVTINHKEQQIQNSINKNFLLGVLVGFIATNLGTLFSTLLMRVLKI